MIDNQSEQFKKELRCYKGYISKANDLKQEIDDIWYELTGVKAIRYDKLPSGSYNPSVSEARRLNLSEKVERKIKELDRVSNNINYIDSILSRLPKNISKACIDIYCDEKGYKKTSQNEYISDAGLFKQIDKALAEVLKS